MRLDENVILYGEVDMRGTAVLPSSCVTNANVSSSAAIARSKLAQDALKVYPVPLSDFRVWDAFATALPATSSSDDLGLYTGTWGTDVPTIETGDVKASTITRYARVIIPLPAEYDTAETVVLRASAGMKTTVADTSATIDFEAYRIGRSGLVSGSDIVATAATSINSLTAADKDFTITATTLSPGDMLDVRMKIAVTDAATGTAVIARVGLLELLCDVRG